jgi:hypothetical protein
MNDGLARSDSRSVERNFPQPCGKCPHPRARRRGTVTGAVGISLGTAVAQISPIVDCQSLLSTIVLEGIHMQTDATVLDWARLVRAEYAEMPGLKLTERQIQRLWCLDAALCDAVIVSLLAGRFLKQTRDDAYVRFDRGA